jgi:hypothetical protein
MHDVLTRRLRHLSQLGDAELGQDILPIGDLTRFVPGMIAKVVHFVEDNSVFGYRSDDPPEQT